MTKSNIKNKKSSSKFRLFLLSFIPFIVFSIGFIPVIITTRFILYVITFNRLLDYVLLPFIVVLELLILLVSQIIISGAIINIFNIKYKEGTYEYNLSNKTAFKWMLLCQLYTPIRKLFEIIPMGKLRTVYLKMLGMRIGKNNLIGGVIKDPCVTEIGNNVTMGEYAIVYAHIHNYEKETLIVKKVKIKDNCIVGAGAIIMPGVVMEEGATLGAGSLATKNRVLEKNKKYGGNPAQEIQTKKKKSKIDK